MEVAKRRGENGEVSGLIRTDKGIDLTVGRLNLTDILPVSLAERLVRAVEHVVRMVEGVSLVVEQLNRAVEAAIQRLAGADRVVGALIREVGRVIREVWANRPLVSGFHHTDELVVRADEQLIRADNVVVGDPESVRGLGTVAVERPRPETGELKSAGGVGAGLQDLQNRLIMTI